MSDTLNIFDLRFALFLVSIPDIRRMKMNGGNQHTDVILILNRLKMNTEDEVYAE